MKHHRQFLSGDRIASAFQLCAIMMISILIAFAGLETLKTLPGLTPDQKNYLDSLQFPVSFKLLLVVAWGFLTVFMSYTYLAYKYSGFLKVSRPAKAIRMEIIMIAHN